MSGSPGPSFAPRMDGPGGFAILVSGSATGWQPDIETLRQHMQVWSNLASTDRQLGRDRV